MRYVPKSIPPTSNYGGFRYGGAPGAPKKRKRSNLQQQGGTCTHASLANYMLLYPEMNKYLSVRGRRILQLYIDKIMTKHERSQCGVELEGEVDGVRVKHFYKPLREDELEMTYFTPQLDEGDELYEQQKNFQETGEEYDYNPTLVHTEVEFKQFEKHDKRQMMDYLKKFFAKGSENNANSDKKAGFFYTLDNRGPHVQVVTSDGILDTNQGFHEFINAAYKDGNYINTMLYYVLEKYNDKLESEPNSIKNTHNLDLKFTPNLPDDVSKEL